MDFARNIVSSLLDSTTSSGNETERQQQDRHSRRATRRSNRGIGSRQDRNSVNNNNNNYYYYSDTNGNNNDNGTNMASDAVQFIANNLSSFFGTNTDDVAAAAAAAVNQPQDHHQQYPTPAKIPPISNRVLNKLPILTITKEDLIDPNNRQCSVCFDDIQFNQKVVRLIPYCGHTFCSIDCIRPWLLQQATCPVCRYELPTDASDVYEKQRQIRMSYRKPRLSKYDLSHRLTIAELKLLLSLHELRQSHSSTNAKRVNPKNVHFTEKQEIINYILDAGDEFVDWITMPDPVKYTLSALQGMSISQLKNVMNNEAGVYFENQKDIVEKSDMLQYFILSGRLQIIPEEEVKAGEKNYPYDEEKNYHYNIETDSKTPYTTKVSVVSCDDHGHDHHAMIVETIYCDDDDDDDDKFEYRSNNRTTVSGAVVVDERENPDMLMEEDLSYVPNETFTVPFSSATVHERDREDCANVLQDTDQKQSYFPSDSSLPPSSRSANVSFTEQLPVPCNNTTSFQEAFQSAVESSTNVEDEEMIEQGMEGSIRVFSSFQDRSIGDLKALARELQVDLSGCLERSDIVNRIVESVSARSTPQQYPSNDGEQQQTGTSIVDLSVLENDVFGISEIRLLTMLLGVDVADCYNFKSSMIVKIYEAVKNRPHVVRFIRSLEPIAQATTMLDIQTLARQWNVTIHDCIEKREIVRRLIMSKY